MTQAIVAVGAVAGDGTGDKGQVPWNKFNANSTELYSKANFFGIDSGVANAYVVALASLQPQPAVAPTLVAGLTVSFIPANASTTAATLNFAGTGVIAIVDPTGAALDGPELLSAAFTTVKYTGAAWQIILTNTPALIEGLLSTALLAPFLNLQQTPAELAAGVTPTNLAIPTEPWYDIKRYGAALANTNAQNLAALTTAISVAQASSGAAAKNGVTILIPPDCHYGYNFLTPSTWPQINSGTVPITVLDFSQGDTYDNYPTRYDGQQQRTFFYTPQTTSPGQHNGNGALINGNWFPYYQTSVNIANAVPSVNSYDNLRAGFITAWQQRTGWSLAQGSLSGAGLTPAQMLNFYIQQGPAAQATINFNAPLGAAATSATFAAAATLYTSASGNWLGYSLPVLMLFSDGQIRTCIPTNGSNTITFPALTGSGQTNVTLASQQLTSLIIDYLTLNWMVGASSNDASKANYYFKAAVDNYTTFLIESLSDPCLMTLRDQTGAANDVSVKNNAGALALNISGQGDALVIAKATRNAAFSTSLSMFNAAPPTQSTGWGTPTGGSAVANFPGATATLLQATTAIAQIIADLKSFGRFGA